MTLTLRGYQQECLNAHYDYFAQHDGNPLMVLPTASGKSVIQAAFLRDTLEHWPDERVLCLTHVKELIRQNHSKLMAMWPEAPAGIYSAGLSRREIGHPITFAGIQSIYRKGDRLGHIDLVLIDEVHLVPKRGSGMYRKLIADLREINPDLRLIGYTATPYRLDGGYLHEGDDRIFTDIAYDLPVRRLIDEGYLSTLVSRAPKHRIDTTGLRKRGGEFIAGELDQRAANEDDVHASVSEAIELSAARKHWLIFACGIQHADLIHAELLRHDINARTIYGHTRHDERDETIAMAKRGELTALVNVGVLTTGFDWPECDALWLMRPTESTGLYVQMIGRGMRIAPEKENCLVLDYGENVLRHGPIDCVDVKKSGTGGGSDSFPAKACPVCSNIVPTAVKICPDCGYQWPAPEPKIQREASDLDILSRDGNGWRNVDGWNLARHKKFGRPDSVHVIYYCGFSYVSEWICPEHEGYARTKFTRWWFQRGGQLPAPQTVTDVLDRQGEVTPPHRVLIVRDGKYDRIRRVS